MMEKEKWLYLECNSGISGDMTVGALLDLGADKEVLKEAIESLGIDGYHLHFGRKLKCGIDAFDFDVHLEGGEEHSHGHEHSHEHGHSHEHEHEHTHEHEHSHEHKHGHEHAHSHEHGHAHVHRNITDIFEIIDRLKSSDSVKNMAKKMFTIVAGAESKAHGIPVEQVHFHEVGAVDSIIDIISVAVCLDNLGIEAVVVSPLAEGQGYVYCQHGVMPVPVPATANIAAAHGLEFKFTDNQGEMVTPTGAAIAAAVGTKKRLPERYTIEKIGNGAGNKDFKNANILRAMIISPADAEKDFEKNELLPVAATNSDRLWILETNMDDCTGECLGFVMDLLLEEGARDVYYTSAYMKKNRPGYVLHVMCETDKIKQLESAIFANTTTIGIRRYPVERTVLTRKNETADTRFGPADVKICRHEGQTYIYPEYESIKKICRNRNLAFTEVYHAVKEDAANRKLEL